MHFAKTLSCTTLGLAKKHGFASVKQFRVFFQIVRFVLRVSISLDE